MDGSETRIATRPARRQGGSWVDALIELVERVPWPVWSVYAAAAGVLVTVEVLLVVSARAELHPFALYFALAGLFAIALMHHLREHSGAAFDQFRPDLPVPDAEAERLRAELTTLPGAMTALLSGSAAVVALALLLASGPLSQQVASAGLPATPLGIAVNLVIYALNWAAIAALVYRAVRQSRIIDRIIAIGSVDLFRQTPLHGFAWLSARSVIGLGVLFYAPLLLQVDAGNPVGWTFVRVAAAGVLVAVFLWPLLGVHSVLVRERERLLARSFGRAQTFYAELHDRLERGERGVVDVVKNEVDTLEREQRTLRTVPTWPWSADVVPTVMGAIVLPLVLSVLLSLVRRFVPA